MSCVSENRRSWSRVETAQVRAHAGRGCGGDGKSCPWAYRRADDVEARLIHSLAHRTDVFKPRRVVGGGGHPRAHRRRHRVHMTTHCRLRYRPPAAETPVIFLLYLSMTIATTASVCFTHLSGKWVRVVYPKGRIRNRGSKQARHSHRPASV